MDLSTYIKDLLYRYECVILPGFGAFLTNYQPARIEENGRRFHPPGKSLSFNRQLQTNDGILANYVASVEGISYELALQKIRNLTGDMSLRLSEGETVSLASIGSLSMNTSRKVEFQPTNEENFNRESFGLSSFVSPTIERIATQKEPKVVALSNEKRNRAIPIFRYAAIGLIAISLGGFTGLKIYENEVEKYNFAERQKADSLLEQQIQEATFEISNPLSALRFSVPKQSGKYHIVAGAFRIEENAQTKVKELNDLGYKARIIGVNKYGLHQVVYSSHEDRTEALTALRTVKRVDNRKAWLLVQELDQ